MSGNHMVILFTTVLNPNPDRPSFPTFGSYAYGENVDAAGGGAAATVATSAAALLLAAAALVKLN